MPSDRSICPVCGTDVLEVVEDRFLEDYPVRCERCGIFEVTDSTAVCLATESEVSDGGSLRLGPFGGRQRAYASAWIRERSRPGFRVDYDDIERLATVSPPSVLDRIERLIISLGNASDSVGAEINAKTLEWEARAWALDQRESSATIDLLEERGLIETTVRTSGPGGYRQVKINASGWEHLDQLRRKGAESTQGFVAMWFDDYMEEIYEDALYPAIRRAGYRPHRVDKREHADRIDDEIVAQIRQSKFVVADYTGHRGGVYWEAGFAKGLGRDVFLTCRMDSIKDLHFDVRQYICIDWLDEEDLRDRLQNRIEAVLGPGPLEPGEEANQDDS